MTDVASIRTRVEPEVHRRILAALNAARRVKDLTAIRRATPRFDARERPQIFDERLARSVLETRDHIGPNGFGSLDELPKIDGMTVEGIEDLADAFGPAAFGQWRLLAYDTMHPSGESIDVAHAALLHTGKVLFIPADYDSVRWPTPIWNPANEDSAEFEYPVTLPGYALFCGGHSFLSNGTLLVVGGGGDNGVTRGAIWGFKFDPVARTWTRTAGSMNHGYRWYPTVLTLGDFRSLITCGDRSGDMEVYNESTDRFTDVTGDTRRFENLYPGFHLLPTHAVFYSRTGWGSARAGDADDDVESAFFSFSPPVAGSVTGGWTSIKPAWVNRAKGMSVMILHSQNQNVRILVVGGALASNNTYETIDATAPTPESGWSGPKGMPDGQSRRQCNLVLLPDGTAFLSGGVDWKPSPCALYDPARDKWWSMAPLVSMRTYHSVALLLPSGKVLVAGGDGTPEIEIFSPPYLFKGTRPVITSAPDVVQHEQEFAIDSPHAADIAKVVLVRPMAVTHQTDTEQRVIELAIFHDPAQPNRVFATGPSAEYPHSLAPQGYYMLFAISRAGVPSEAKWIALASPTRLVILDRTPIATRRRHDDHMELWVVDAGGTVRGIWWNGDWQPWYALPNASVKFPQRAHLAAVGRHRDHMEVFGVALDGNLHGVWWDGDWHEWFSLGAPAIPGLPPGTPALVPGCPLVARSRFRHHMEVWVVAADRRVWSIWWDGDNWQQWQPLSNAEFPPGAPLAVHCRHDDHMEIWGIDEAGTLRGNWWNGAWQSWYALPTPQGEFGLVPGGHLAVLGRHDDHMEIWTVGGDDRMHGIWWDGAWRDWYTLDGPFSFPPGAPLVALSRNDDDHMEVWCVGEDGHLHGVWWNGSWEPWYSLGQFAVGARTPLAALSRNDDHMEVWCVGPDDATPFVTGVHGTWFDGSWHPFYRLS